jgi:hypothetical protein
MTQHKNKSMSGTNVQTLKQPRSEFYRRNAYVAFPLRMFEFYGRAPQHFPMFGYEGPERICCICSQYSSFELRPLRYQILFCKISDSHSGVHEAFCLLRYGAVYSDGNNPTFRRRISPPSSGSNKAS